MTKLASLLFTLIFIAVPHAQAEVMIQLPGNTEPLLLNEKIINDKALTNANGPQQLVFKLLSSYRAHGVQERFSSEAVILSFNGADNEYTVELPKIKSAKDGDAFNMQPEVDLRDKNGNKIDYKIDTLIQEGIQLGRNYQQEIRVYNQSQGAAVITAATEAVAALPAVTNTQSQSADPTKVDSSQVDVGKMLDFWYSQADEETREAFKKRIGVK